MQTEIPSPQLRLSDFAIASLPHIIEGKRAIGDPRITVFLPHMCKWAIPPRLLPSSPKVITVLFPTLAPHGRENPPHTLKEVSHPARQAVIEI